MEKGLAPIEPSSVCHPAFLTPIKRTFSFSFALCICVIMQALVYRLSCESVVTSIERPYSLQWRALILLYTYVCSYTFVSPLLCTVIFPNHNSWLTVQSAKSVESAATVLFFSGVMICLGDVPGCK